MSTISPQLKIPYIVGQVAEFNNWQDDIREMNTGLSSQDRYVFDDDEAGGKVIDEEPGVCRFGQSFA